MNNQFGLSSLIVLILLMLLGVLITQMLWNSVMTQVFSLKEITFWDTFGLLILANIFFGGHCNASTIYMS